MNSTPQTILPFLGVILATCLSVLADGGTNTASLPASLDLATACSLAMEHNPSIRMAKEAIRMQDGTVMSERAAGLPQLDAVSSYSATDKGRIESFGGTSQFNDQLWYADLQVSQSLFSGGRLHYTLEAQAHMSESLQLGLEDTTQAVIRDTTERFQAALLAKARIAVYEESVALLANELTLSSNRFVAGVGQHFDVLRAEVALHNEQPLLARARYEYDAALDSLRQVIGIQSEPRSLTEFTLIDGPDAPAPADNLAIGQVTSDAIKNRPSQLAAEKEVLAGESNLKVAERGHMPSINVTAAYGFQNRQFEDNITDTLDGWKVGIQLDWPIFDSQLTKGDIMIARATLAQKHIQQDASELAVENDVRREFNACKTAREILIAADLVIEQATEALRLAQNRLATGVGTQQDVLDAQVDLSRSRLQKASARYEYNVAAARLKYATGTAPQK